MRALLIAFAFWLGIGAAQAAPQTAPCIQSGPNASECDQVTSSNPLPVVISGTTYADPCGSPSTAKSSAAISVTSATTTSLVAVSGSTTVYVCGVSISIAPSATSADTALFEYGTGAACSTPTSMTGTFGNGDLTTAAPPTVVSYGGGGSTIFKSAASGGICMVTAGTTVNVQGVLTYVQQ